MFAVCDERAERLISFRRHGIFGLFCSTFGICQPKLVGNLQVADVIAIWVFYLLFLSVKFVSDIVLSRFCTVIVLFVS